MEIFLVSFLVFAGVALMLVLSQRVRGSQLPVGCRPESGECCGAADFGNCLGPSRADRGSVEVWPEAKERA